LILIKITPERGLLATVKTITRYFEARIYKYLKLHKTLMMRGRDDIRIIMQPGCTISEKMYISGLYDRDGMETICGLLTKSDVFYDVGANVGPFSLLAANCGAEVYAFEGHPETIGRLRANFSMNGLDTERALNLAVSSRKGHVIFSDVAGSAVNKIVANPGIKGVSVGCISLDEFS